MHAVGIKPIEPFIRAGHFPVIGDPPFVLGWDVSGVVDHATPDTWRFRPGDEVFGMPFFPRAANGYAELVAAPARQLARKPASLDHVHAAALPLVGLTAWQGLVDTVLGDYGERSLRVLRPGGVLVSAVDRTNLELAAAAEAAGVRFAGVAVDPDHAALERLAELVDEGHLRVHVERTFRLERVADAHRLSETNRVTGKIVLTVA